MRAENPKMTVGDVAKELGRRWETIKDRSRFEALAAKDKARYEMVGFIFKIKTCNENYMIIL